MSGNIAARSELAIINAAGAALFAPREKSAMPPLGELSSARQSLSARPSGPMPKGMAGTLGGMPSLAATPKPQAPTLGPTTQTTTPAPSFSAPVRNPWGGFLDAQRSLSARPSGPMPKGMAGTLGGMPSLPTPPAQSSPVPSPTTPPPNMTHRLLSPLLTEWGVKRSEDKSAARLKFRGFGNMLKGMFGGGAAAAPRRPIQIGRLRPLGMDNTGLQNYSRGPYRTPFQPRNQQTVGRVFPEYGASILNGPGAGGVARRAAERYRAGASPRPGAPPPQPQMSFGQQLGGAAESLVKAPFQWVGAAPNLSSAAGRAATLFGGGMLANEAYGLQGMSPGQRTQHLQQLNDPNQTWAGALANPIGEMMALQHGRELATEQPVYGEQGMQTDRGYARPLIGQQQAYTPLGKQRVADYESAAAELAQRQLQVRQKMELEQQRQSQVLQGAASPNLYERMSGVRGHAQAVEAMNRVRPQPHRPVIGGPQPALPPQPYGQPAPQQPQQPVPQARPVGVVGQNLMADENAAMRAYLAGQR